MDAQSLHEHQGSTQPKQRLGLHADAKPVVEISGNDDIEPVKNDPERPPEESEPDIEIVEVIEPVTNKEPAPELNAAPIEEEPDEPDESEEYEEEKPNPWTPDAIEERQHGYRFTSTSIPKQEHRSSIEPAKPVRNNANAVILILLIAILLITVSIYAVILAREEKAPAVQVQPTTSEDKSGQGNDGAGDSTSDTEHILKDTFGVWHYTNGDGCFVFDESEHFYWYQACSDISDNYHYGKLMGVRGSQALYELNMTYDEAIAATHLDVGKITTDDFYYLNMDTVETVHGGIKRTTNLMKPKMLFARVSDSEAALYNTEKGDGIYHLEKISNNPDEWRESMMKKSNP